MHVHLFHLSTKSQHWYAQCYVGNRRHRFSCKTPDKRTARQFAQQQLKQLQERHNRGLVGLPDPIHMSHVFDRYEQEQLPKLRPSSQLRTQGIVAQARSWFVQGALHDPLVAHVASNHILAFLEAKGSEGVCPRTVNLYRATLHRIFRLCVRPWLLIQSNPVAATEVLREEPREPQILKEDDYQRLLAASSDHAMFKLFVTLAWETGGRSAELLQLQWSDVDFHRKLITFANDPTRGRQTKGRRSRTVPLSAAAVASLRSHAAQFRLLAPASPYIFKHLRSNRSARPGDQIQSMYALFKRAAKSIGLTNVRPHDLRHSFVTRKLAEGVTVQLVSKYVGHADLATTMRYTHLVPEHLRAVVSCGADKRSATY